MWAILTTIVDTVGSCSFEFVWGFFARHAGYVQNLEDNLSNVETILNSLTAAKEEVMQKVLLEEQQQQKKRLPSVALWFERVDKAVAEGQKLIECGDRELQRLCLGGYCSTHCWSTSIFGKSIDTFLNRVPDLLEKPKEFDQVTAETPASYVQKLEDDLAAVKISLENLAASKKEVMGRVLVEEQQQKKRRLASVVLWFERVEKAADKGQELIQGGEQELQGLCLGGYCSTDSWSTSVFGKEVHKFLNLVRDLLEKSKEFDQVAAEIPAEELVFELPCDPTVGLKTKFEEVWSCLENKDVVGVYGIGGVGKTTLLTQIHNKFVDTSNDVLVIWAVVGKDTPPQKVQENIAKKIGSPVEGIFNKLRRQKFVLFLDDVWKRVDFTKIGIPSQEKLNGSKIIFSTRSSKVCNEMRAQARIRVEVLESEDAWELFRKHAGEDTINIDPEITPLAKSMANKCGGLPIALKVVGRAMSGKLEPREWRHSIKMLKEPSRHLQGTEVVDELLNDMEVEVFEILKFSYDSLSNDKWRSCFQYCALYPYDHLIYKDSLVDIWICEDFWDNNGLIREARDEAYSIIDTFIRSCLLEDEGDFVKMHDVIRDMALWLEKDYFVMAEMHLQKAPGVENWDGVKRLSLMYNDIEELTQVPPCPKLVTLFLNDNWALNVVNEDFFHFMSALIVLDMSYTTELKKLPKSIEKLTSLQFLNISRTGIEELPVELATLRNLVSLNISYLQLKANIKGVISGMLSLRVLKMLICYYSYQKGESTEKDDEEMFLDELDCLEHLEELQITIKSVHSIWRLNIKSRKLLTSITAICLADLKGSGSLNICLLRDMKYLSIVMIFNCDLEEMHYDTVEIRRAAAAASISISSTSSLHLETLISFSYLRMVVVNTCNYLKDLTVMLVLLPNLTMLQVANCYKMEEIISVVKLGEEVVDLKNRKFFSKLSRLYLDDLPELRCIYQDPLPFPLLRLFAVDDCPLLKKLPFDCNSRDGPKIVMESKEEWWEGIEWKDDDTKVALLPRFKCKFRD